MARALTNEEAYGGVSYERRTLATYEPGDVVRVGPAYQMGGTYRADGMEGVYTVVRRLLDTPDWYLAQGVVSVPNFGEGAHWDVICHAARIAPVDAPGFDHHEASDHHAHHEDT